MTIIVIAFVAPLNLAALDVAALIIFAMNAVRLWFLEAMWKVAAVIGGNFGGIKHQIADGVNDFLLDNVK